MNRRRMMLMNGQEEKELYIRQGIITIEEDFNSLDSDKAWDDFAMFYIGVTNVPENYGIVFYRLNEDKPIINNTIGACYWVKSNEKADNFPMGNFSVENQRRVTVLSSTISQRGYSDAIMYTSMICVDAVECIKCIIQLQGTNLHRIHLEVSRLLSHQTGHCMSELEVTLIFPMVTLALLALMAII